MAMLMKTQKQFGAAFLLIAVAGFSISRADESLSKPATSSSKKQDHFLSKGGRYRIVFPATFELFTSRSTEVTQSTSRIDGNVVSTSPVTWEITLKCEHFIVRELGPRGWVQVEHPSAVEDYGRWKNKLVAIHAIESKKLSGDERLAAKKQSALPVRTTKTWINIDQAIAVQDFGQRQATSGAPVSAVQTDL